MRLSGLFSVWTAIRSPALTPADLKRFASRPVSVSSSP
jgi:hypothetical protein